MERFYCTDAIPVSTFICEYYLGFRGLERAESVPLDRVSELLLNQHIDLAVNIHSFSECRIDAIDWWLSLVARANIPFLMIVPNANEANEFGASLVTRNVVDIATLAVRRGFRLVVKEPKYRERTVQRYAVNPTYYYLFERAPMN